MLSLAAQPVRLPLVGLLLLAFLAFGGGYAARLETAPAIVSTSPQPAQLSLPHTTASNAATDDCQARTAYVTGDMVGDASPATVYAAMCSKNLSSRPSTLR